MTRVERPRLELRTRIDRMRARSWALQILYAWEAQSPGEPLPTVMDSVFQRRAVSPVRIPFVSKHVRLVAEHLDRIDKVIGAASENWRIERLSSVDRSVLRLAVAEMLYLEETPPKVAIQEAIRLAGQYGGEESPRFVNGVLDAVYTTHLRDRR